MPLLKEPPLWYGTHTAWRRVGLLYRHPQPSRHLMGVGAPRGPPGGGGFGGQKPPKMVKKQPFLGTPWGDPKRAVLGPLPPPPYIKDRFSSKNGQKRIAGN